MSWIISLVISFAVCAIVTPLLIPFLKKLKFGQMILEDGPTWHAKKQGTPTMGGLGFIFAIAVASLIVSRSAQTLFVVIIEKQGLFRKGKVYLPDGCSIRCGNLYVPC